MRELHRIPGMTYLNSKQQRSQLRTIIRIVEQNSGRRVFTDEEYKDITKGIPDETLQIYIDRLIEGYPDYDIVGALKEDGFPPRREAVLGYGR